MHTKIKFSLIDVGKWFDSTIRIYSILGDNDYIGNEAYVAPVIRGSNPPFKCLKI